MPLLVPGALRRTTENGPEIDPRGMVEHMQARAAKAPPPTTPFRFDVRFPDAAARATHVYIKIPKKAGKGLGPLMAGPYPIVERIGKSVLLLDLGKDASGNDRHKIYHWANCQPAKLAPDIKNAVAPQRGRPRGATSKKPPEASTKAPSKAGPKTPISTGKEPPVDSPADDQSEEEDEQPNPTTTKYGRKSKPPQRFGCGK